MTVTPVSVVPSESQTPAAFVPVTQAPPAEEAVAVVVESVPREAAVPQAEQTPPKKGSRKKKS